MITRFRTLLLGLVIGAFFAGYVSYTCAPVVPAEAQVTGGGLPFCKDIPVQDRVTGCAFTKAEDAEFRRIMAQLAEQPIDTPNHLYFQNNQEGRSAFGRALHKASSKIPPKAGKAGLAAGAATLGLTMWYFAADGSEQGLDSDLGLSPASGSGPLHLKCTASGGVVGSGVVTGATWTRVADYVNWEVSFSATSNTSGCTMGAVGVTRPGYGPSQNPISSVQLKPTATSPAKGAFLASGAVGVFFSHSFGGDAFGYIGNEIDFGVLQQGSVKPDEVFAVDNVGNLQSVPAEYTPPSDDAVYDGHETYNTYEGLKSQPEYQPDPAFDPNADPDAQPDEVVWTRQNPDGSVTERLADGTERTTWPDGWTYTRPEGGTGFWTRPDGTPKPDEEAAPHETPPPGGSSGPAFACPVPLEARLVVPELDFERKFPFSLILWVMDVLDQLGSPSVGSAPVIHLPVFDRNINLGAYHSQFMMMRNLIWFFSAIAVVLTFYTLIKGGRNSE